MLQTFKRKKVLLSEEENMALGFGCDHWSKVQYKLSDKIYWLTQIFHLTPTPKLIEMILCK